MILTGTISQKTESNILKMVFEHLLKRQLDIPFNFDSVKQLDQKNTTCSLTLKKWWFYKQNKSNGGTFGNGIFYWDFPQAKHVKTLDLTFPALGEVKRASVSLYKVYQKPTIARQNEPQCHIFNSDNIERSSNMSKSDNVQLIRDLYEKYPCMLFKKFLDAHPKETALQSR